MFMHFAKFLYKIRKKKYYNRLHTSNVIGHLSIDALYIANYILILKVLNGMNGK